MGKPFNLRVTDNKAIFNLTNRIDKSKQLIDICCDLDFFNKRVKDTGFWYLRRDGSNFYCVRTEKDTKKAVFMHFECFYFNTSDYEAKPKMVIDHIDRDSLNNQASNLRLVSIASNVRNSNRVRRLPWFYKGYEVLSAGPSWKIKLQDKSFKYSKTVQGIKKLVDNLTQDQP